jgi:ankyrin repeat protein
LIQPIRGIERDNRDNEGFFECMEKLLQHGVDPNVSKRFGQTVLHFAAARGNPSEAERARFAAMLLDHGARFDLRDELLMSTALGWACRWGRRELVELLIARGAPANEPDAEPWATPLAWAVKMGHTGLAELLRRAAGSVLDS